MPKPNPMRQVDGYSPNLTPPAPMPWMDSALCIQIGDPDIWFGESRTFLTNDSGERESAAKAVCSRCEVRAECLEYALTGNERYGIWGGKTPAERLRIKRRSA